MKYMVSVYCMHICLCLMLRSELGDADYRCGMHRSEMVMCLCLCLLLVLLICSIGMFLSVLFGLLLRVVALVVELFVLVFGCSLGRIC